MFISNGLAWKVFQDFFLDLIIPRLKAKFKHKKVARDEFNLSRNITFFFLPILINEILY